MIDFFNNLKNIIILVVLSIAIIFLLVFNLQIKSLKNKISTLTEKLQECNMSISTYELDAKNNQLIRDKKDRIAKNKMKEASMHISKIMEQRIPPGCQSAMDNMLNFAIKSKIE